MMMFRQCGAKISNYGAFLDKSGAKIFIYGAITNKQTNKLSTLS
jgi:hypothetical protein